MKDMRTTSRTRAKNGIRNGNRERKEDGEEDDHGHEQDDKMQGTSKYWTMISRLVFPGSSFEVDREEDDTYQCDSARVRSFLKVRTMSRLESGPKQVDRIFVISGQMTSVSSG